MKMWKGNGNITILLFSLNGLKEYTIVLPEVSIEHKEEIHSFHKPIDLLIGTILKNNMSVVVLSILILNYNILY